MKLITCLAWLVAAAFSLSAELLVTTTATRSVGKKAVITLGLTNSYPEKIESARATVFLLDAAGKVVGQNTRWIIGGSPEQPGLAAKSGTLFHFVIETDHPFATNRVFVNRVVLEGGRVVSPSPPAAERVRSSGPVVFEWLQARLESRRAPCLTPRVRQKQM